MILTTLVEAWKTPADSKMRIAIKDFVQKDTHLIMILTVEKIGAILTAITGTLALSAVLHKWAKEQITKRDQLVQTRKNIELAVAEIPKMGEQLTRSLDALTQQIAIIRYRQNTADRHNEICTFFCEPDGKCQEVSQALCNLFGLSEDEMLGFGWAKPIEDNPKHIAVWKAAVDNDYPYADEYIINNVTTRRRFRCQVAADIIRNTRGEALGYCGCVKVLEEL